MNKGMPHWRPTGEHHVIERNISPAAGASPPLPNPGRYQEAMRRLAIATLVVTLPGAALRVWPDRNRMRRSWPPGASL